MAIVFSSEYKSFKLKNSAKLKSWIKKIINSEQRLCGDLSYVFVNDEALLGINRQYLDHNTYTDIITFDYSENKTVSGEIFISVDRIKENAAKFETSFENELHRVIIHGVLHLCGYKDKSKTQAAAMRKKENSALLALNK